MGKIMIRKWGFFIFTLALIAVFAAPGKVQASTKKQTLYVGDEIYLSDNYKIKSISVTDKNVISVTKDKSAPTHAKVVAKQAGKSTVTVKSKKGTYKFKITVKDIKADFTFTDLGNNKLLIAIKNNSKQTFTSFSFKYVLKNAEGIEGTADTKTLTNFAAGRTVYTVIKNSDETFIPDATQCTAEITKVERSLAAKYTDASSKSKLSVSVKRTDKKSTTMKFKVTAKNKLSQYVCGDVYILIYDENGTLVNLAKAAIQTNGKSSCTATAKAKFASGTDTSKYTYKASTAAYTVTY